MPIKETNKRNYYLNMCIKKSLSKRELENELKSFSYERFVNKKEKIELIIPKEESSILDNMKNPTIIKL